MKVKCPHCNNIIIIVNANDNNANNNNANDNNANDNNANDNNVNNNANNNRNNRKNAIYKDGLNRLIHENYDYS